MAAPEISTDNLLISAAVFLGTMLAAAFTYLRARKAAPEIKPTDVVVAGGMLGDMTPVRECAEHLKAIAAALELMNERAAERDAARNFMDMVDRAGEGDG